MTVVINGTTGITSVNGTAAAPSVTGTDTDTGIVYGTNTLSLATGGTTAVTVDSSQNVGIGTSSVGNRLVTASSATNSKIEIQNTSTAASTSKTSALQFSGTDTVGTLKESGDIYVTPADNNYVGSNMLFYTRGSDSVSERARIDSSGNLSIGGTAGKRLNIIGSGNLDITYKDTGIPIEWNAGPVGTGAGRFNWYNATTANDRMYLTPAGALYNSTGTYGTISDVSLKENIVDATPKLDDVMRIRVRNFNLLADPEKRKVIGVVAQELEEVFPGLIEDTVHRTALEDGSFDEAPVKAVKYSVLTTILVKAIQEQQAIIEQLRADVEALKGQA